ncbi:hypothetical protein L596_028327 [Steinernema carpocapsae]|uniref:Uncharacterized protein n=1 Tax=Steinernema carpocapsae TaxID=34508 RepID=A0A4U5LY71_STECR|nr:hypothetical protein L596_028327 [Steinernema carpocapsae]
MLNGRCWGVNTFEGYGLIPIETVSFETPSCFFKSPSGLSSQVLPNQTPRGVYELSKVSLTSVQSPQLRTYPFRSRSNEKRPRGGRLRSSSIRA